MGGGIIGGRASFYIIIIPQPQKISSCT